MTDGMNLGAFRYEASPQEAYTSEQRKASFPLLIPGNQYINLGSFKKSDILRDIRNFVRSLPGQALASPYCDNQEFYENPSQHQFYIFRRSGIEDLKDIKISNQEYQATLSIFLRSKSQDETLDAMLESLHESTILRQCADCTELDRRINQKYQEQFKNSLRDSRRIINKNSGIDTARRIRRKIVHNQLIVLYDTLVDLSEKGFSPKDVLDQLSFQEIIPYFSRKDPIIESTRLQFD